MRTILLLVLLLSACAGPAIVFPDDTPDDLTFLSRAVFADFLDAFPAQTDCIGRVEIHAVWDLSDRALYHPEEEVIEVRIPGTAPQLKTSLVHELGHHLEQACPGQLDVRPAFLRALGLPGDAIWPNSSVYETDPSELWAEAVVRHVTGNPDRRRPLTINDAALEVVARWASGELGKAPGTP